MHTVLPEKENTNPLLFAFKQWWYLHVVCIRAFIEGYTNTAAFSASVCMQASQGGEMFLVNNACN